MKIPMTDTWLKSLKPTAAKQVDHWDAKQRGLGIRVNPKGTLTWQVRYDLKGRIRRLTLARYPDLSLADARVKAREVMGEVAKGADPAAEKQGGRQVETFKQLAEKFIEEHAKINDKTITWHQYELMLSARIFPVIGNRKAREITRREIAEMVKKIALERPSHANHVLALIKAIYGWARTEEIIDVDPARDVRKPGVVKPRERYLSDHEIVAVMRAAEADGEKTVALYKLWLLTGQREMEIAGATWDEMDLHAGWWTIPSSRTKNHKMHRVPLVGIALEILKGFNRNSNGSPYVFPGRFHNQSIKKFDDMHKRVLKRSRVDHFTIHDLRRTCATGLAKLGVPFEVISKVLNHSAVSARASAITLIYDRHEYDHQKRDGLAKWDRYVNSLINTPAAEASVA